MIINKNLNYTNKINYINDLSIIHKVGEVLVLNWTTEQFLFYIPDKYDRW